MRDKVAGLGEGRKVFERLAGYSLVRFGTTKRKESPARLR
jgi:hypothetical protein